MISRNNTELSHGQMEIKYNEEITKVIKHVARANNEFFIKKINFYKKPGINKQFITLDLEYDPMYNDVGDLINKVIHNSIFLEINITGLPSVINLTSYI